MITILLVEDNDGDIFLTKEVFEHGDLNSNLIVVKDGYEALNFIFQKGKYKNAAVPDLILLDINLPKINGHEVLHEIKSSEKHRHIPVIMLTTSKSDEDILISYQNHANCYITKPMDVNDFIKGINCIKSFWGLTAKLPNK